MVKLGRSRTPRIRPVPAVSRALAILRLLSRSNKSLGVNAISRELGMIPSTCLHIVRVLVHEEFLAVNPATKQYRLEAGVLSIARPFLLRDSFRSMIQPTLDFLADKFGVTAVAVQVSGLSHMVVIAIAPSELPLRVHVEIGSRFPALMSATGRCVAAFGGYPRAEIELRFPSLRWFNRAPTLKQWRAQIEFTRKSGYAVDEDNYIRGVTVVAVPILDANGLMSHALAAVGVSEQIAKIGVARLAEDMRTKIARFSKMGDGRVRAQSDLPSGLQ